MLDYLRILLAVEHEQLHDLDDVAEEFGVDLSDEPR